MMAESQERGWQAGRLPNATKAEEIGRDSATLSGVLPKDRLVQSRIGMKYSYNMNLDTVQRSEVAAAAAAATAAAAAAINSSATRVVTITRAATRLDDN